jgi:hypothetical protein
MKQDLMKRLDRLEAVAGPDPQPPEIWLVDGDMCHMLGSEPITRAQLELLPNSSTYPRIFFRRDSEGEVQ